MTTREEFLAEARTWIGTPYRHQGRDKNGVDCVGFPLCVAAKLGIAGAEQFLADPDMAVYQERPSKFALLRRLQKVCRQIPVSAARPGDLICILVAGQPQHVAIFDEGGEIIHAIGDTQYGSQVCRQRPPPRWIGPGATAFEIPGLD